MYNISQIEKETFISIIKQTLGQYCPRNADNSVSFTARQYCPLWKVDNFRWEWLLKRNGSFFSPEMTATSHFYGSTANLSTRLQQRWGKELQLLAQPQYLRQNRQYIFQTHSRALKMVEPSVLLLRRSSIRDTIYKPLRNRQAFSGGHSLLCLDSCSVVRNHWLPKTPTSFTAGHPLWTTRSRAFCL